MDKKIVMLGATVGTSLGGYVPTLFGAEPFGGWSILGGLIGGLIGIWVGVKAKDRLV